MVKFVKPRKDTEIARLNLATVRAEYKKLSDSYKKILDGDFCRCTCCGEFLVADKDFYKDRRLP